MMKDSEDAVMVTETKPGMGKAVDDLEKDKSRVKPVRSNPVSAHWNNTTFVMVLVALVVLVVIIVLSVVLTRDTDKGNDGEDYVPVTTNFITGVSLVTYYNVNATISQRLARTVLTMEIANALDCTSIHGVTLQLPLAARVASLSTIADDGCKTRGEVQGLDEARETFAENAAAGLPTAYVEARDDVTYSLQVSLPPMGTTTVELVVEELLRQKVGKVEFQLPFVPNEEVDQILLQINILDASSEVIDAASVGNSSLGNTTSGIHFVLGLGSDLTPGSISSPYALEITDARQHDLPRILHGEYKPSPLPDQGVLFQDGNCFEYTFLPGSLTESKPKNVIFLVDISSTYGNERFFADAKEAIKEAIDHLTPQDTLRIQTYGQSGTVDLWGLNQATETKKIEAKKFVDSLVQSWGCNFHEALLQALLREREQKDDGVVTLMVVVANSWADLGETNRAKIAGDVWNHLKEGKVKLFSLGSQSADLQLLNAMAVMNGGVTISVMDGQVDYTTQISTFFASELGNVLLSDVHVSFEAGAGGMTYGETPLFFPVLAAGTEAVVRGLLNRTSAQDARSLVASATAISPDGPQTWTTAAVLDPFMASVTGSNSRCFQSYAHSRITQLLSLRDVAILLGDSVVKPIVTLNRKCNETTSFADCLKAEALSLALEAQVVTKGLTGLVTIDGEMCMAVDEEAEICLGGTNKGDFWETERDEYTTQGGGGLQIVSAPAPEASDVISGAFGLSLCVTLASLVISVILFPDLLH